MLPGDAGQGPVAALAAALLDLVLPGACAGCAATGVPMRVGLCGPCVRLLEALQPYPTAPVPTPAGFPPCVTVGPYDGALRSVLLAYKERGRHRLARGLGALLATAVARSATAAGGGPGVPLVVVPVPSTARAARQRNGDHLARLATHTVHRLRTQGWQVELRRPLRALPRPDSAGLDTPGRVAAAESSLRVRSSRIRQWQRSVTMSGMVIVLDDIVTTGTTLAAVATRLGAVDVRVDGAAVLAATRLRRPSGPVTGGVAGFLADGTEWANRRESVP